MTVEISLPPSLQTLADNVKRVDVSGGTVGECLGAMIAQYPRLKGRLFTRGGKILKGLNIYVNGERVSPEPLARPVRDGDKIHLAYLIFGG
jgi:molybdopterin converting factor small subunit